jgi:NAD(P)-dependent dehydrogenase (short-subunit alcohol dehydrogenase family)
MAEVHVAQRPVVVITGASSGIGRATALRFAGSGASLVLAARGEAGLASVAAECEELGGEAEAVPTDVTDAAAVQALADRAVERFGRIDVWVNDAAVGVYGLVDEVPLDDIRRVLDVNVLGCVNGVRAALPRMKRQGSGVIINVASLVAPLPQPYTAPYSMSKAAVRSLGASVRSELRLGGHTGIAVCTVLPPAIDTPFFDNAANYTGRRVRALPPVYAPEHVARTIMRLARHPRREAIVGTLGRSFVQQGKVTPGTLERSMAVLVEHTHLSRTVRALPTKGNLYEPSSAPTSGSVHGGWQGRRKTRIRSAIGIGGTLLLGGALLVRRARR